MLASEVRAELRSLSRHQADRVACHLVAAGRLVDSDPHLAVQHARQARRMAARIGPVREAVGIAAYHASEWAEALTELRAARRLTGDPSHLPLMADCERAMGRPERALRIAQSPEAGQLDRAGRIELALVEAGARRDLGEIGAALMILQRAGVDRSRLLPWSIRLWYAYADTLAAAGRLDDAAEWFLAVAGVDNEDQTDAEDRLVELGVLEPLADRDGNSGDELDRDLHDVPDGALESDPDGEPGRDLHDGPHGDREPSAQTGVRAAEAGAEPPPSASPAGDDVTEPPREVATGFAVFREPRGVAEQASLPQATDNSPE